ncbi:MAG: hypothetical protein U1E62_03165 [Alsobacter sp.]
MPSVVLIYLFFNALCVVILVLVAERAPLCDENENPIRTPESLYDDLPGRPAGGALARSLEAAERARGRIAV